MPSPLASEIRGLHDAISSQSRTRLGFLVRANDAARRGGAHERWVRFEICYDGQIHAVEAWMKILRPFGGSECPRALVSCRGALRSLADALGADRRRRER